MLTTNLLPPQEKKAIWLEETRRLILFFLGLAAAGLLMLSALLLPSYLPLVIQRRGLEESLFLEEQAARRFQVRETLVGLEEILDKTNVIKSQATAPSRASDLLEQFLASAGPNITIAFFGVKSGGEVVLNGQAAGRRDLLQFEKTLRESSWFEDISSPLSNIIRETDINFSIRGRLKSVYRL